VYFNFIKAKTDNGDFMNENEGKLYRRRDEPVFGQPETCGELLHKYGTYEIQPTNDSDNSFPKISQGLPTSRKRKHYKGFNKEQQAHP
jgi:hypothetical protein